MIILLHDGAHVIASNGEIKDLHALVAEQGITKNFYQPGLMPFYMKPKEWDGGLKVTKALLAKVATKQSGYLRELHRAARLASNKFWEEADELINARLEGVEIPREKIKSLQQRAILLEKFAHELYNDPKTWDCGVAITLSGGEILELKK